MPARQVELGQFNLLEPGADFDLSEELEPIRSSLEQWKQVLQPELASAPILNYH